MIERRCEGQVRAGSVGMQPYFRQCEQPATHKVGRVWLCAEHAAQAELAQQTDRVQEQMRRNREKRV